MNLALGLTFDNGTLPYIPVFNEPNTEYLGPIGLVRKLEKTYGRSILNASDPFLRVEKFRQIIVQFLKKNKIEEPFFSASFLLDPFEVAKDLLSRRDELLMSGWDFDLATDDMPTRLKAIAELHHVFSDNLSIQEYGFADKVSQLISDLKSDPRTLFSFVYLNEPFNLLPPYLKQIVSLMFTSEAIVSLDGLHPKLMAPKGTDLWNFQTILQKNTGQSSRLNADGTLIIIKGKRSVDVANYLGRIISLNDNLNPNFIIPELHHTLDLSLSNEGFASLGLPSTSLARPNLQILRLLPYFFWQPIDPEKVLEFLSLSINPFSKTFAYILSQLLVKKPGIGSKEWTYEISNYFNTFIDKKKETQKNNDSFWYSILFKRKKHPHNEKIEVSEVSSLYNSLLLWIHDQLSLGKSMINLLAQTESIVEVLEQYDEEYISRLEIEKIIKTIYAPVPLSSTIVQKDHLPYTHRLSSVIAPVDQLIWWNFTQTEPAYFFNRWYREEYQYLSKLDIFPYTAKLENELLLWQRNRPVFYTTNQLILVKSEVVDGNQVHDHPLMDYIVAAFENLNDITFDIIDDHTSPNSLAQLYKLPIWNEKKIQVQNEKKLFIDTTNLGQLYDVNSHMSYSQLRALLYYPQQWLFKYVLKLNRAVITSLAEINLISGNIAHRIFDILLNRKNQSISKEKIFQTIDDNLIILFEQEGLIFYQYGMEPIRTRFVETLKSSAWNFIYLLNKNNWTVQDTEIKKEGFINNQRFVGVFDVILQRGDEIAVVDLKWSGKGFRSKLMKNNEDLQLGIYANLSGGADVWTLYYIINSKTLLAKTQGAFSEAEIINREGSRQSYYDQQMLSLVNTWNWRKEQIKIGKIEVRIAETIQRLEEYYLQKQDEDHNFNWNDLLELPSEEDKFEEYNLLF